MDFKKIAVAAGTLLFFASILAINLLITEHLFYQFTSVVMKIGSIILISFLTLIVMRYLGFLWLSFLNGYSTAKTALEGKDFYPGISIIVPAYNEEVTIRQSLLSLIKLDYPKYEVIVIDDGSKDKTYHIASSMAKNYGNVTVRVFKKKNGGKARALNYGIERATYNIVMCVDADSKLERDVLKKMVRHFKDPHVAAVAGAVKVSNADKILTKLQQLEYIEGLNMSRSGQGFMRAVNIIPGPIGMFKKDALKKVGYYDSDTFAEDCDLTLKLITAGFKIDYEPDAMAWTEAPEEVIPLIKQRYRWTRGILQSIRKHSHLLWNFKENPIASFTLWYMQLEGIWWPFMDIFANIFLIFIAATYGLSWTIVNWWVLLTIIDGAAALFCLIFTGESLRYMLYVPAYRIFYITFLNIVKVFATIEEWFNLEMSWGKLERKGKI
ncbi:glycosyltransferase [Desulfurobacterium sp.]